MINRQQVNEVLDALEKLEHEDADVQISSKGKVFLRVYPENWYKYEWSEEKRHSILALLTPFVGKLEKTIVGKTIGYKGEKDNISILINYADQCKIVGYKTVTKTVRKEVEREPEYADEEIEERIAITDCDIRTGKFSENDIEVNA